MGKGSRTNEVILFCMRYLLTYLLALSARLGLRSVACSLIGDLYIEILALYKKVCGCRLAKTGAPLTQ